MADHNTVFDEDGVLEGQGPQPKGAAIRALRQTIPAALEPIPHQECSPTYLGYLVAIPAGWRALSAVLYPIPDAPDEPAQPGVPAAILKGMQRFRVGVLLCHLEADGQAAAQEAAGGVLQEAAFLNQDGQYLQSSQGRPGYALLPLAAPSSTRADRSQLSECLVLWPSFNFPLGVPRESLPPVMMFINGVCVYRSDAEGEAA